ncbi:hypothetical protein GCM10010273_55810 [Streptomyces lavendulocolor]
MVRGRESGRWAATHQTEQRPAVEEALPGKGAEDLSPKQELRHSISISRHGLRRNRRRSRKCRHGQTASVATAPPSAARELTNPAQARPATTGHHDPPAKRGASNQMLAAADVRTVVAAKVPADGARVRV